MFDPGPSAPVFERVLFDSLLSSVLAKYPEARVSYAYDDDAYDISQRYENLTEEGKREREALVERRVREASSSAGVPPDEVAFITPSRANDVQNKHATDPGDGPRRD